MISYTVQQVDSLSDTILGLKFFQYDRPWWGVAVLSPVFANTMFTMIVWARQEEGPEKKWTWALVLLQVCNTCTIVLNRIAINITMHHTYCIEFSETTTL